ncbi:MAG: hypothetical protein J6M43_05565 [Neisseriaceae bacterium]|nr:hypothetical protein [Neisseriaceae bacterium]
MGFQPTAKPQGFDCIVVKLQNTNALVRLAVLFILSQAKPPFIVLKFNDYKYFRQPEKQQKCRRVGILAHLTTECRRVGF